MAGETSYPNDTQPIVDPATLEFRRAITSEEQGLSVINRLKQDSLLRNEKQAAIMRKYNDEPPYDPAKLAAANQDWRWNASTGFMSGLIKRILPSYNQVIDQAQFLTSARFPGSEVQDAPVQQKETDFRNQITLCIRSWLGWQAFKGQVILENLLFGFSGAGWTDEITWQPRFLRQDEAYFPDGCSQESRLMPLWCLDQNFQIHEMANYLVDPEASAAAGWNIENIVNAINQAKPENRNSGTTQDLRKYQDMIRESSLGTSYSTGVKIIKAVHLFVQEVNGKVSHYIYDERAKKLLFMRLDRFDSMTQNLSLMTLEVGNGKLHGSKGAGRVLYNTHISVDQARNLIYDSLMLSGLLVLEQGDNAKPQEALQVMHPVAIIGKDFKVVPQGFQVNSDAFFAIDRQMTQIAETAIGAFMPGQIQDSSGEKRTASEINYTASIEQELKNGNLARFYQQFQYIITEMQKRICSHDNILAAYKIYNKERTSLVKTFSQGLMNIIKGIGQRISGEFELEPNEPIREPAIECCLAMLRKGLTPQDIYILGQSPSYDLTDDTTAANIAALTQIAAAYKGDPNVDQVELTKKVLGATLGDRVAQDLIIPAEDNTLQSEATRLQLMELQLLLQGEPVPVSPRDFDPVHLQVLQQKAEVAMQNPQAITPQMLPLIQNILQHFDQHLQQAIGKAGGPNQDLAPFIQFAKIAGKLMGAAQKNIAAQQSSPAANPNIRPATALPSHMRNGSPQDFTHDGPQPPAVLNNPAVATQEKPLSRGPLMVPPGPQ